MAFLDDHLQLRATSACVAMEMFVLRFVKLCHGCGRHRWSCVLLAIGVDLAHARGVGSGSVTVWQGCVRLVCTFLLYCSLGCWWMRTISLERNTGDS
jgi:hypothetical protein